MVVMMMVMKGADVSTANGCVRQTVGGQESGATFSVRMMKMRGGVERRRRGGRHGAADSGSGATGTHNRGTHRRRRWRRFAAKKRQQFFPPEVTPASSAFLHPHDQI